MPQIAAFDTGFPVTCSEVVSTGLAGRRTRKDRQRRIADALAQVDLAQHAQAPFFRLSGGQRQRVLIARAISAEAPIIALDEPTVGVDAESCTQVWELLQQLGQSGKLVLVVTHDLFRAPQYSDRLLNLDGGQLSERTA